MIIRKAKIFHGNNGSVQNELNLFLKNVAHIVAMTQSYNEHGSIIITLIYVPMEAEDENIAFKPSSIDKYML